MFSRVISGLIWTIVVLVWRSSASVPLATKDEGVYVLDTENFKQFVESQDLVLVEFYAPWCGHCKRLEPIYSEAAKVLESRDPPLPLAKVDTTQEKDLAKEYGIKGFPTLKLFKKGIDVEKYSDQRTVDSIVGYMNRHAEELNKEGIDDFKIEIEEEEGIDTVQQLEEDEEVLVLNQKNFEQAIKENQLILVEFYAPWCGHCVNLAPEYEKAAVALKSSSPSIALAKIDGTVEVELMQKYGVKGFPTLIVFKDGEMSEYQGGRTADSIVEYMKKKAGPAAQNLNTVVEAVSFIESNQVAVIGFFDSDEGPRVKSFLQLAEAPQEHVFGICTSVEVAHSLNVTYESMVVFKKYEEPRIDFTIPIGIEAADLSLELLKSTAYLIERFTVERAQALFSSPIQTHALLFGDIDGPEYQQLDTQLRKAATVLKGLVQFVSVPLSETRLLDFFGVDKNGDFKLIIADMRVPQSLLKFKFEGSLVADEIENFAQDVLDGKVEPYLKSEEPKDEDSAGMVKEVRGKSFEQMVIENSSDVLLKFYAPWCGHCKALAPLYENLAEELKDIPSVTIAKIDATANEILHPGVFVQGFPTIYLFPGNAKDKPIPFNGERELEALINFIKENAATPFTLEKGAEGNTTKSETESEVHDKSSVVEEL